MNSNITRKWLLATSIFAGVASVGVAAPAVAQNSDESSQVADIVVTGSRIVRKDFQATSPIVTVSAEDFQATGAVTIDALLNELPQFTPSFGQTSNNPSNGGQANLNLRNLGSQRTVVLLNGRRLVPSNSDGSADVNLIPTALLRSVETISGGASAAYGSDAIGGVANFILNDRFEGVQFDAQYGQTERNDGETQSYSVTVGSNFADDRGNAVLSVNRSTRGLIFNADRDFAAVSGASGTTPLGGTVFDSTNLPLLSLVRDYFNSTTLNNTGTFGFNNDGTLFAAAGSLNFKSPGGIAYDGFYAPGSNYVFNTGALNYMQLPLERWSAYSAANYKLNDNITFYADALFNQYQSSQELAATPAATTTGFRVPSTNPFIPADLKALLNSRPNPDGSFQLNKRFTNLGGRKAVSDYTVYQLTGGARGQIPYADTWTYDVYAQYGRVYTAETQTGNVSRSSVQKLLDSPTGGADLCEGGFNPFGDNGLSAECISYIGRTSRTATTVEQTVIEGSVQGVAFELPAGELRVAMGIQYRENTYDYGSDPLLATINPLTPHLGADGLPDGGDIGGVEIAGFNAASNLSGSTNNLDIFGEALIPILANKSFVESLELTLGYRASDYNTIGTTSAYRADLDWAIANGWRVRGGYNRSVRAPSVGELYSPMNVGFPAIGEAAIDAPGGDPCDVNGFYRNGPNADAVRQLCLDQGLAASAVDNFEYLNNQVNGFSGGNPNLKEETADTWSFGLVYQSRMQSPWLSRLSGSLDYYNIEIKKVISSVSIFDALEGCFNGTGENPNYDVSNSYCQLFDRDPLSGGIINAIANLDNLGGARTSGIDLQVDWSVNSGDVGSSDWGTFGINSVISWLDRSDDSVVEGGVWIDRTGTISDTFGTTYPKWKSLVTGSWAKGPVNASLRWRHVGEMNIYGSTEKLKATDYFDLMANYDMNDTVQIRVGVNNISDQKPRTWDPGVQANTDPSTYDTLGRRYFIGLTGKF